MTSSATSTRFSTRSASCSPRARFCSRRPEVKGRLERYDPTRLSWVWTAEEAGLDELQQELAALVEATAAQPVAVAAEEIFAEVAGRVRIHTSKRGTEARRARAEPRKPISRVGRTETTAQRAVVLLQ